MAEIETRAGVRLCGPKIDHDFSSTGGRSWQRDTLSLALSEDEGKSWTPPAPCVNAEQISYPFILETEPGRMLVSCHHVREGWRLVTPVLFLVTERTLLEQ